MTSAADNNMTATAPWRGLLSAGATKKYNNMLSAIFITSYRYAYYVYIKYRRRH